MIPVIEHDPEKWKPVFGKDHAPIKHPGRFALVVIGLSILLPGCRRADKRSRSRGAIAPEFCRRHCQKILRSPIASCHKPVVGPVCGSITLRTTKKLLRPLPDFTVSSGLRNSLRSLPANNGSGTPTDAHCMKPHRRMRPRAKRRALACRRSTTALAAATERHRSAPVHALPGTVLGRDGRYPPPAVPVQRAL